MTRLEELEITISNLKRCGVAIPQQFVDEYEHEKSLIVEGEYIYSTLKLHSKFPVSEDKDRCIRKTVEKLLAECPNATVPVLLLGKIQCGKTDTFENIVGLAFDKGIDVCVVFTKGTKALAEQTMERMVADYTHFSDKGRTDQPATIKIFDIIKQFSHDGLPESTFNRVGTKVVIVCKKQADNMAHLIDLFTKKSPYLQNKKVLVVDDEADFCSRNYVKKGDELTLAKISEQIVDFIKIPTYCRYLQVTATPYSLYLQPDGTIELNEEGKAVPTFKPRYTILVPEHNAYIGGKQYFVDSEKSDSMYSHLFIPVMPKCIDVMGKRDERYLHPKDGALSSVNIIGLTHALIAYIMAAAIRSIQSFRDQIDYKSSALFHVDIDKTSHGWQEELVNMLVRRIREEIMQPEITDRRVIDAIERIFNDYKQSNEKARAEGFDIPDFPSRKEVLDKMRWLFEKSDEIKVQVVNSDNDVQSKLNKDGQLNLTSTCNIFIGGNILDRGITINNMLCFFYGRDPRNFQMDTVLQHCRMYGARAKADMAVTRFYTTEFIYKAFKTMNQLDEQLRQWFVKHNDDQENGEDFNAVFVGYEKHIKPCAPGKIRISNVVNIRPQMRCLPIGFQTGPKSSISKEVEKIQKMIEGSPYFDKQDEHGIFEIPVGLVKDIIVKIRGTYVYNDNNEGLDWDVNDMLGTLQYAVEYMDTETMYCIHRTDRNMSRYREDGIKFIDAPDDGRTDLAPARAVAVDKPLIMFIKQNGKEENGWKGTPFYWPVLIVQQNIDPVVYTVNEKSEEPKEFVDASPLVKGIDPSQILHLTLKSEYFWKFITGEKYSESREITESTASRYLIRDYGNMSRYKLKEGIKNEIYNIHSANNGVFPFELRKYQYILFRTSHDKSGSVLLVKVDENKPYSVSQVPIIDEDILIDKELNETDYVNNERLTQWVLEINCKSVGYVFNKRDEKLYDSIVNNNH